MKNKSKDSPPMIFGGYFHGGGRGIFLELDNIAWRIEQAKQEPANPLIEPKYPWDSAMSFAGFGTVLKDPIDGLFKAWMPSIQAGKPSRGDLCRLTYAYSEDGIRWTRPKLNICPFPGYPKTNILLDYDSGGTTSYASVFVDPEENPDEPYEMFCYRNPYFSRNLCVAGFNQTPAKDAENAVCRYYGLYRYRSKDGLHWRGVEGPIKLESGDTLYIHKDRSGQGYICHHKGGGIPDFPAQTGGYIPYDCYAGGVRINQRRTSPDGSNWSETIPIMYPDWQDGTGDQIMELGYYPYGNGIIGVVAVYHAMSQRMDIQFAGSYDGINWWRPRPRQACLANASLGDIGGGLIWPTRTLIEDNGCLNLYYGATDSLHGDIYASNPSGYAHCGGFCRASWEKGRLWAAVPASGGDLTATLVVYPNNPLGQTLYINGVTSKGGEIMAELLDASPEAWDEANQRVPKKVVRGYSRDDCAPFRGDHKNQPVTWKGRKICGAKQRVCLKLYMKRTRLYGFEWR